MGSGSWSSSTYTAASSTRRLKGVDDFAYSTTTRSTKPATEWKAHNTLDPNGVDMRESRDSAEHPTSLAITVLFDVTGSMHTVPRALQEKLPTLLEVILRKGYVEHPQICFGAIGDATCDRVPLQVAQFESDNRLDEHLRNIFLESGGGGGAHESYELALYFMARHMGTDCWDKRHHRGYMFIIGDEMPYSSVKPDEVKKVIGDDLAQSISVEDIVREVQERWQLFLIRPEGASYRPGTPDGDEVIATWRKLLGQNVIDLEDLDSVCETVALQIGLGEGTIDLDEGLRHLKEFGVDDGTRESVARALVPTASGAVVPATGSGLDLSDAADSGTVRI